MQTELNVAVPMRDGVVLRADVFRPDAPGPYPVLVVRTPYNKDGQNAEAYVKAGYIVVRQDARGRYASEGKWESFYRFDTHDAEDGFDTVEWAAKLPGSNGKVGILARLIMRFSNGGSRRCDRRRWYACAPDRSRRVLPSSKGRARSAPGAG